jgi:dCMP deaminase
MSVLIAYIPALHKGYIDFFKKYPDELFILGKDLVLEQPRMDRDIRAMDPEDIMKAVEALSIFKKVTVLTKENLKVVQNIQTEIVMPDEDVSRIFVESNLKNTDKKPQKQITFIAVFLRWDGHSAQKTNISVNPDRKISTEAFDKEMMEMAYELTKKSSDWWRNIGALVVQDKKILLTGYNHPLPNDQVHNILGDPRSNFDYGVSFELSKFLHAEAAIIAEAAKKGISLDGTTLYVTTFPCPVCAKSVATAGIKKVFYKEGYSLLDAEDILKSFNVEIVQVQ